MIPHETLIAKVMAETGMGRLQAIRHIQMRHAILASGMRKAFPSTRSICQ